jgi:hypothetical protein
VRRAVILDEIEDLVGDVESLRDEPVRAGD